VLDPVSVYHRNLVTLRGVLIDGTTVSVSGTLMGITQQQRIVEVNGFDVEVEISDHMAFFVYQDRPGIVGAVGQILGDGEVNIESMQVSRDPEEGRALMAMSVDRRLPIDVLDKISNSISAQVVRGVDLA